MMWYLQMRRYSDREGEHTLTYECYAPNPDVLQAELEKVSRSGDHVMIWYGHVGAGGEWESESDEPMHDCYID